MIKSVVVFEAILDQTDCVSLLFVSFHSIVPTSQMLPINELVLTQCMIWVQDCYSMMENIATFV